MTEQISQMRTQRRMGSHQPPASNISSPLYQRILQFQALSSIRQQGTDVRAAEGLGYNDAALKDLFKQCPWGAPQHMEDEGGWTTWRLVSSWSFLACSPARAAGVPQAGLAEAAAPSNSRPFPERLGLIHSVQDPPLMSVRAAWSARGLTEVVVPAHDPPEAAVPAQDPPRGGGARSQCSSRGGGARSQCSSRGGGARSQCSSRGGGARSPNPGALVYLCLQGLCRYTGLAHHPSPWSASVPPPSQTFFFFVLVVEHLGSAP